MNQEIGMQAKQGNLACPHCGCPGRQESDHKSEWISYLCGNNVDDDGEWASDSLADDRCEYIRKLQGD